MSAKIIEKGTLAAVLCMILDQAHKFYMIEFYNIDEKKEVYVNSFFNLVLTWNRGISFGMFQNFEYSNYFFIALTTTIVLLLFVVMKNAKSSLESIAVGAIIGGALGNLIDRILLSAVADFFDFHYKGNHWPAFNVADSCVFVGAALLIVSNLAGLGNKEKSAKKRNKVAKGINFTEIPEKPVLVKEKKKLPKLELSRRISDGIALTIIKIAYKTSQIGNKK